MLIYNTNMFSKYYSIMGKTFRRNGSDSYSFGKSIRDKRQKGSKNRFQSESNYDRKTDKRIKRLNEERDF